MDGNGTLSLDDILRNSGLTILSADASPEDIQASLLGVALAANEAMPIVCALLRDRAIKEIRRIGLESPARVVDSAFATVRTQSQNGNKTQEKAQLGVVEVEPWPEPVDGSAILSEMVTLLRRFVVLPPFADILIALWVLFAHCYEVFNIAPILAVTSPEKRCAKTLLLEILANLVARPLSISNITAAALFRCVGKYKPTLLVDEVDTYIEKSDDLRGILNSGHRLSGAFVLRCIGDNNEPKLFPTFGPRVIAKIGDLPDTIADRAIIVSMKRKTKGEKVDRFRLDNAKPQLKELQQKAARWARDNGPSLKDADPQVPEELNDRAADNLRPILSIADNIGGEWPDKARKAALSVCVSAGVDSDGIRLLEDIKTIFDEGNSEEISSKDLVEKLKGIENAPWGDWNKGKGITMHRVAKMLKPFDVKPDQYRKESDGKRKTRGYCRADFNDAFERYLSPADESEDGPTASPAAHRGNLPPSPPGRPPDKVGQVVQALFNNNLASIQTGTKPLPEPPLYHFETPVNDCKQKSVPFVPLSEGVLGAEGPCYACGRMDFWQSSSSGGPICRACHPPPPPDPEPVESSNGKLFHAEDPCLVCGDRLFRHGANGGAECAYCAELPEDPRDEPKEDELDQGVERLDSGDDEEFLDIFPD